MHYRLVIFDFDGTLADSADWFRSQLDPVADRFEFRRPSPDELEALRGMPSREIMRRLRIPLWKLPRIARYMRELAAHDADAIRLFPGVGTMLAALNRHGFRLAIVSSNAEENVRHILGNRNAALIDDYACGAALLGKARKLRQVARRAGISPEQAIAVGDETRDIEAAKQAGMASAAISWGYATAESLARFHPTIAVTNLDALVESLQG